MRFNNFISDLFTVSRKADKIRQDEEKRAKSVHFAITACIFALVGIAYIRRARAVCLLARAGNRAASDKQTRGFLYRARGFNSLGYRRGGGSFPVIGLIFG